MRRLAILTAVAGLALTIGLAAQTGEAHAMMQQCTGDGALTLNPDGTQTCGSTEVVVQATTVDGVQVTIEASDPTFAEALPEGAWVEVELIPESVVAATAIDSGSDQLLAASATDAKNTAEVAAVVGISNGEFAAATSYAYAMVQNQPRGTSDPAGRGESVGSRVGQAVGRAVGIVYRATLGRLNGTVRFRERVYYPDGQLMRETEFDARVG